MQVSVEKTSELSRKMTVSISEEVIQEKMEARFKSLAREVKLDGFRPGKVPQHVVKKMFGDRVRGEIAGDLIQSTYFEALQGEDLSPVGPPHIHPSEEKNGFEYTAEFEVYPEVAIDGLEQIEVSRPVAEVAEPDLDDMVENLRQQKKHWKTIERAAQELDRITIHFSGVSEGENFTDGKVENYQLEIGSKQMIPGFEDNLIGLQTEANKSFVINFPDEYGNEKLAGKAAEFEIEVIKVEEPSVPEVDADFIIAYGIEDGDLGSFHKHVKANMTRELSQALRGRLKNAVMDALYENIQLKLPKTLIDQEIDSLMKPYQERAKQQNMKLEDLNLARDTFEEQAKRRVALGLIMAEIIQQNEIKVESGKVRTTIEEMAKSYEQPEDVVNWYYAEDSRLTEVEQMVLEDQTVDWVLEKVKVTDEAMAFNEIMNPEN